MYKSGLKRQSSGSFAKAIDEYFCSLRLEKNSTARSFIFLNLGILYFQLNQKYRALLYFTASIRLNPENSNAANYIGVIYYGFGNELLNEGLILDSQIFFERAKQF